MSEKTGAWRETQPLAPQESQFVLALLQRPRYKQERGFTNGHRKDIHNTKTRGSKSATGSWSVLIGESQRRSVGIHHFTREDATTNCSSSGRRSLLVLLFLQSQRTVCMQFTCW
jgi:hypothetical protein